MENPSITQSVWRKMILGQHHGLPTRLMDWSRSPLMSLHFAMTEGNLDQMDQRDCVLWRIDIPKLNRKLPEQYKQEIRDSKQQVSSLEMLQNVCKSLKQYDHDMAASGAMVMMEPPTIDMRIANQYSYFSIVPSGVRVVEDILNAYPDDCVTKYVIDKNIRWEIRDMLDQANISERLVYPGLDGIATWLGRHYFVRDLFRLAIKCESLADLEADVIVNPSNTKLLRSKGVNDDIFHKAGAERLTEICTQLAPGKIGDVIETEAFGLRADKIYHVIGRNWDATNPEESKEVLSALYRRVLERVKASALHCVGFPLLGTGFRGCPYDIAWKTALQACKSFQDENQGYPLSITFCVIEASVQAQGEEILKTLEEEGKTPSTDYRHMEKVTHRCQEQPGNLSRIAATRS